MLKVTLYLICDEQKEWAIFFYFNPLALRALPLSLCAPPQHCGGAHSDRGERDMHQSVPVIEGTIPSLLAVSRSITGAALANIKEHVRKGKGVAMYL